MTVHEVLLRGYPLVERGWVPHAACGDLREYCMFGAIGRVLVPEADIGPSRIQLWAAPTHGLGFRTAIALAEATGETVPTQLHRWNDQQTKERVLEVWRKALAATAPKPPEPDPEDFTVEARELELVA